MVTRGSDIILGMGVDYVCEWCGYAGHTSATDDVDQVQCSQCGELVVPIAPGGGIVDGIDD